MDACTDSLDYTPVNELAIHKAIKKVSSDIEAMKFNTAIAALMSLVNDFYANGCSKGDMSALLMMLSPFAPHMVGGDVGAPGLCRREGHGVSPALGLHMTRARPLRPRSPWPFRWAAS